METQQMETQEKWVTYRTVPVGRVKKIDGTRTLVDWQISNLGRVRKINKSSGKVTMVNQYFGGGHPGNRYYVLPLNKPEKYVHRLVALNFVLNPDPVNRKCVDHIDGDKLNNTWTNLRWVTTNFNINSTPRYCPHCDTWGKGNGYANHIKRCKERLEKNKSISDK